MCNQQQFDSDYHLAFNHTINLQSCTPFRSVQNHKILCILVEKLIWSYYFHDCYLFDKMIIFFFQIYYTVVKYNNSKSTGVQF